MLEQRSRRTFLKASGAAALGALALPKVSLAGGTKGKQEYTESYLEALIEGDFESGAGCRISLSRAKGIEKLCELAKRKDKEVAAIFISGQDTWITTSKESGENFAVLSLVHADHLLKSGADVEFFHTHVTPTEERVGNKYWWMVPGFHDLNRSVHYNDRFKRTVRESIVTEHGTITYWPKDLSWLNNLGDYRVAAMKYEATLKAQASALSRAVKEASSLEEFGAALKDNQDFLEMNFQPR